MMNENEFFKQLQLLREKVFNAVRYCKERGEPGKSYEGTFEVHFEYPSWCDNDDIKAPPCFCEIRLHCYLIGPSRHYTWTGKNMESALNKCRRDIEKWCKEDCKDE